MTTEAVAEKEPKGEPKGGYSGVLGPERYRRMMTVKSALNMTHSQMVETTIDQAYRRLMELQAAGKNAHDFRLVVYLEPI